MSGIPSPPALPTLLLQLTPAPLTPAFSVMAIAQDCPAGKKEESRTEESVVFHRKQNCKSQ